MASQIDAFRQEAVDAGNDYVVIHAGDALTGTSYYSFYGPAMDAAFMNTVGFDVMVAGNHEFDDGDENFANFTALLDATMITANCKCRHRHFLPQIVGRMTCIATVTNFQRLT